MGLAGGTEIVLDPEVHATAPRANQHPPRAASGRVWAAARIRAGPVEGLGLVLTPVGMASCTWSSPTISNVTPPPRSGGDLAVGPRTASLPHDMGSLIKKRRKRMRKKKHKKMLKATRWQRRAGK